MLPSSSILILQINLITRRSYRFLVMMIIMDFHDASNNDDVDDDDDANNADGIDDDVDDDGNDIDLQACPPICLFTRAVSWSRQGFSKPTLDKI